MAEADAQRNRLLEALRDHGMAFAELGRHFGARMDLHSTDGHALIEILSAEERGEPLTQAALSHRVGLTPGATSSLLNRLEKAGHVTRARDSADRRIVSLRATDGVEDLMNQFFAPLVTRIDTMLANYSSQELAQAERFITDYVTTMNHYIDDIARSDP